MRREEVKGTSRSLRAGLVRTARLVAGQQRRRGRALSWRGGPTSPHAPLLASAPSPAFGVKVRIIELDGLELKEEGRAGGG